MPEQQLSLRTWAIAVNTLAHDKGFYDNERSDFEAVTLIASEVFEALDDIRDDKRVDAIYLDGQFAGRVADQHAMPRIYVQAEMGAKPTGVATELADVIIRVLDFCAENNIDIEAVMRIKHAYNKTRPYRHGGKTL